MRMPVRSSRMAASAASALEGRAVDDDELEGIGTEARHLVLEARRNADHRLGAADFRGLIAERHPGAAGEDVDDLALRRVAVPLGDAARLEGAVHELEAAVEARVDQPHIGGAAMAW